LLAWYQLYNFELEEIHNLTYFISCLKFLCRTFVINLLCVYFQNNFVAVFPIQLNLIPLDMHVHTHINSFKISRTEGISMTLVSMFFFRALQLYSATGLIRI